MDRTIIEENLQLGFALRCCPICGPTSAELDLAENTDTGEILDYCHAGEHFVVRSTWVMP